MLITVAVAVAVAAEGVSLSERTVSEVALMETSSFSSFGKLLGL